ncbi:zinc ribbon domain-containing protein [Lactobacillus sp. Sy-1]|uniref:zinc ribbon domain-containing protein n=1 Tax=Lactobacillus sp. Sy-1 TaxID=2109645 RepID=UPI001C5A2214|nr:zinc ribbon domain-containing protein [Lactobacillus sp. Sy-1]MBW1604916.1 hypothetical protein [Lactobacillus sp. Sy-1]
MVTKQRVACPRCGHNNDIENVFCDYCGFNLKQYFNSGKDDDEFTKSELYEFNNFKPRLEEYSRSNLDPKKIDLDFKTFKNKKAWAFATVALVLIVGGYSYGHYYYSRSATLNRVVKSVTNYNSNHYFVSQYNHQDSTKLVDGYFRSNPKLVENLKKELNSRNHTSDGFFTYQKTGTHFGIFPKYQVVINNDLITKHTYAVKIKTKPYAVIMLNGKVLSYADSDGNYNLNHLTSDEIYINAKYQESNQGITTKPIKITPNDNKQQITLLGTEPQIGSRLLTSASAQSTLEEMYARVRELTNRGNVKNDLASFFIGGDENRFYQSIHQLGLIFQQNGSTSDYEPQVKSLTRTSTNQYEVKYNLTYRFDNGKRVHIQTFETIAVMQRENGKYQILSVISSGTPIKDTHYQK